VVYQTSQIVNFKSVVICVLTRAGLPKTSEPGAITVFGVTKLPAANERGRDASAKSRVLIAPMPIKQPFDAMTAVQRNSVSER